MPIQVICPSCGAKLKVPDQMTGKVDKCPNCQKPVQVPEAPAGDRWAIVRVGLGVTHTGAIVGTLAALCLAAAVCLAGEIGLFGYAEADAARLREAPTALRYGFPLLLVFGTAGAFSTSILMPTGCCVCFAGAKRSRKAVIGGAVAAFSVGLVSALLLVSYEHTHMPLEVSKVVREKAHSETWILLLVYLTIVAIAAAFVLYAVFLKGIANRTRDRSLAFQTVRHIFFVIALGAWVLITAILVWSDLSGTFAEILPYNVALIPVATSFHLFWLRSLTAQARRALLRAL